MKLYEPCDTIDKKETHGDGFGEVGDLKLFSL